MSDLSNEKRFDQFWDKATDEQRKTAMRDLIIYSSALYALKEPEFSSVCPVVPAIEVFTKGTPFDGKPNGQLSAYICANLTEVLIRVLIDKDDADDQASVTNALLGYAIKVGAIETAGDPDLPN